METKKSLPVWAYFLIGANLIIYAILALLLLINKNPPAAQPTQTSQPILTATIPALKATGTITPTIKPSFTPANLSLMISTPTITATPPQIDCILNLKRENGLVVRVIDGDTINVSIKNMIYTVRYIGIDTPEMNEPMGDQAQAVNNILVGGKNITLFKDVSQTDRFDRLLRYVFVEDTFVNYELVRLGMASSKRYNPDTACQEHFAQAQEQAKNSKSGIWMDPPTKIPPTLIPQTPFPEYAPGCDPSYPTVCIPPPPPDLDCADIRFRNFQVLPPDPHRFDGGGDGIGCEE